MEPLPSLSPISLPSGLKWWLQDWQVAPELTSTFLTDISVARATSLEARRGLRAKPVRSIKVRLGPSDSDIQVQEMMRHARRFSREQMVVPIFADARALTANASSGASTISVDTTEKGRFTVGGRIAMLEFTGIPSMNVAFGQAYTIVSKTSTTITISGTLGHAFSASKTCVLPMLDVKQISAPKLTFAGSSKLAFVELEVEEISGPGSLPSAVTLPAGVPTASDGLAIWPFEQDWTSDLSIEYRREGGNAGDGRDSYFVADGTRDRMRFDYQVSGDRAATWDLIQFFEYHRGRLGTFWHIDPQCLLTVASWQPSGNLQRVLIDPVGSFSDFQSDVNEAPHMGIVLNDGTFLNRAVSSMSSGTVWTVTFTTNLPTGYTQDDVKRIAISRKSRFDTDAMVEGWGSTEFARIKTSIIEALGE